MPGPLVLVTEPQFMRAEAVFRAAAAFECVAGPSGDRELAEAIRARAPRHIVIGHQPYPNAIYGALPRGRVIARFGVGYEHVDLRQATAAGLLCTNTPGVLHESVAELVMLFIAAGSRGLIPAATAMRKGEWAPSTGSELAGKTLAVIGAGQIGGAVARMAAGYHMHVVGCRRATSSRTPDDAWFSEMTSDFGAAVQHADYVSVHIPARPENRHFINAERLSQLRNSAWLINTARGMVVDERALYDALADRRLAGAALDVFDREPYVPLDSDHDLRMLPNVILVPHIGSDTVDANRRMAERALRNLSMADAGDFAGMDLLNPEVLGVRDAGPRG